MDAARLLTSTPIWILAIAALIYLGRTWFDAAVKTRFAGLEKRIDASLEIGKGLRGHEQNELIGFRVAVEEWEYFLQTVVGDVTMSTEKPDFDAGAVTRADQRFFGAVRMASVKASIFLRDPGLEGELLKTIAMIRNLYYPMMQAAMSKILDLQGQMLPYLIRVRQYEASGFRDLTAALDAAEAQVFIGLRHAMTAALRNYAEQLVANYDPIAGQLLDLKARINVHIYRPVAEQRIA